MVRGDRPLAAEEPEQALLGHALGEPAEHAVAQALQVGASLRRRRFRQPPTALGLEVREHPVELPAERRSPAGACIVLRQLAAVVDLAVQPVMVPPGGNEVDIHAERRGRV